MTACGTVPALGSMRRIICYFMLGGSLVAGAGCTTAPHRDFAAQHQSAPPSSPTIGSLIDRSGPTPANLEPMLGSEAVKAGIPAVAAIVLRGNQVVAEGVAGVRRRGSPEKVFLTDQFGIASGGKAFSALLIARLVEAGKLDWDRPLSEYFPRETLSPDWNKVTLRHLITHTAGVGDSVAAFIATSYFAGGDLPNRRLAFARKVLKAGPATAPTQKAVYSNTDYILAGAVAENVTGVPWERLMAQYVFAPLGLTTAGFGPPGRPGELQQPWGHGKFRILQIGLWGAPAFDPGARTADYPAFASPAGYVHLSVGDWAKMVALQLRLHEANPNSRPNAMPWTDTFRTLHALRPGVGYAGGWFAETRNWAKGNRENDTGRVLFHLGDNGRWTSAAWLAPEIDFAVLVTCNRGEMDVGIDSIVGQLIRTYAK